MQMIKVGKKGERKKAAATFLRKERLYRLMEKGCDEDPVTLISGSFKNALPEGHRRYLIVDASVKSAIGFPLHSHFVRWFHVSKPSRISCHQSSRRNSTLSLICLFVVFFLLSHCSQGFFFAFFHDDINPLTPDSLLALFSPFIFSWRYYIRFNLFLPLHNPRRKNILGLKRRHEGYKQHTMRCQNTQIVKRRIILQRFSFYWHNFLLSLHSFAHFSVVRWYRLKSKPMESFALMLKTRIDPGPGSKNPTKPAGLTFSLKKDITARTKLAQACEQRTWKKAEEKFCTVKFPSKSSSSMLLRVKFH